MCNPAYTQCLPSFSSSVGEVTDRSRPSYCRRPAPAVALLVLNFQIHTHPYSCRSIAALSAQPADRPPGSFSIYPTGPWSTPLCPSDSNAGHHIDTESCWPRCRCLGGICPTECTFKCTLGVHTPPQCPSCNDSHRLHIPSHSSHRAPHHSGTVTEGQSSTAPWQHNTVASARLHLLHPPTLVQVLTLTSARMHWIHLHPLKPLAESGQIGLTRCHSQPTPANSQLLYTRAPPCPRVHITPPLMPPCFCSSRCQNTVARPQCMQQLQITRTC